MVAADLYRTRQELDGRHSGKLDANQAAHYPGGFLAWAETHLQEEETT
jgi:hypothetical protein